MQQSSIPGCMEALSMEEYLNKRKKMKEKESEIYTEEVVSELDLDFFLSLA